ncbi:hypothetical protein P167DRAFT_580691, partial [Morchella conica CCBAS932]
MVSVRSARRGESSKSLQLPKVASDGYISAPSAEEVSEPTPQSLYPSRLVTNATLIHTDPHRTINRREESLSSPYFSTAAGNGYSLLNIPGRITRISPNPVQRHVVIDLAFANPPALNLFHSWSNRLPNAGSDHTPIKLRFTLAPSMTSLPTHTPDWKKAPWPAIQESLRKTSLPPISYPIDHWFGSALAAITEP